MLRKLLGICISLVFAISLAAVGEAPQSLGKLSAAEIVNKNVAARGGLQAWRAVQTMSLEGKVGAGGNQRATIQMPIPDQKGSGQSLQKVVTPRPLDEVQLPFAMKLKRPRKMRFELQFAGQTAIQVFDGANGWKLRPYLNRRAVEPYTAEELKMASMQQDLDGPLVDFAAKGNQIELVGVEKVEDRDTYKLKLTMKNGQAIHVWIDVDTFLEAKIEGQPRLLDGTYHPVELYYRDYRQVSGLQVPYVLETKVLPMAQTKLGFKDPPVPVEKIIIDKVVVNPQIDESLFSKPDAGVAAKAN
jgi:hypothetical protein